MVGRTSAGGRGRWLATGVAALCLAVTAPAVAQTTADDLARKHFESGVAYLEESDYPGALRAFEKSYELSKRHEILLNVATVHERAGDLPAAVKALERYLAAEPDGKHAATVKLRIGNLQKRIEESPAATPDAGPKTEPVAPPPAVPPPAPPTPQLPPPGEPPGAEPDRVPAYIAFGVGGLSAIGAIVTGVMAQSEYDDAEASCAPACADDAVSNGKSLAVASTILTGVAIVGAGVGAFLWFTAEPGERPPSARHRRFDVRVGGAPGGGRADAIWRF